MRGSHDQQWSRCLTLGVILGLISLCTADGRTGQPAISGSVTECWEGHPRPVPNLRVYVLSMEQSSTIRESLKKLESLHSAKNTEEFQANLRVYDDFVAVVKSLGEPEGLVRSDKSGLFSTRPLRTNEKYLVLAIDWDRGDTDDVSYYRYKFVDVKTAGIHGLNIFMGPGNEGDCKMPHHKS